MSDLIGRLNAVREDDCGNDILCREAARELGALNFIIGKMQGHTFFVQDADGALRRWNPPKPRAALSTDGGE